ncbi:hypothetical protein G6F31_020337 [Rhizopus arrhizus]|nr:hypothetical protein G6F31_020337 [Rhizopus arrhizus]
MVQADSGAIGGDASQEFHVIADSGEDALVFSTGSDYAANMEAAIAADPAPQDLRGRCSPAWHRPAAHREVGGADRRRRRSAAVRAGAGARRS